MKCFNSSSTWAVCLVLTSVASGQVNNQPLVPAAGEANTQGGVKITVSSTASAEGNANVEVLTRGPVHEAFATRFMADFQPPLAVPRLPPAPINEVPPEMMPEGQNVVWIPGYWNWDEQRNDFIWNSGLWRETPPGQRWVPGTWLNDGTQARRAPGFWTSATAQQLEYLPQPPASQELGPTTAPPDSNHFWAPGSWEYTNNTYQWRAGTWEPAQSDWAWVPSRYYWTPQGYHLGGGYWDYPPTARGTLFSPVAFQGEASSEYRPANVVPIDNMLVHLFVRPDASSYYYGNYYGDQSAGEGFSPWATAAMNVAQADFYDPLWSYYRAEQDGVVLDRLASWNSYYQLNPQARPAATLAEAQEQALRTNAEASGSVVPAAQQAMLVARLDEVARGEYRNRFGSFRQVDVRERQDVASMVNQFRDVQQARAEARAAGRVEGGAAARGEMNAAVALRLPQFSGADSGLGRHQPENRPNGQGKGRLPDPPLVVGRAGVRGDVDPGIYRNPAWGHAASIRLSELLPHQIPELPPEASAQAEQQRLKFREQFQIPSVEAANTGNLGNMGLGLGRGRGGPSDRGRNPNAEANPNPGLILNNRGGLPVGPRVPGQNPNAQGGNLVLPGSGVNPNVPVTPNANVGGAVIPNNPNAPNPNAGAGASPNPPTAGANDPAVPPGGSPGVAPNPPAGGNNPAVPPPSFGPGGNPNPPAGGLNPAVAPPSRGPGVNPNPPTGGLNPSIPPPSQPPSVNPNPPTGGVNPSVPPPSQGPAGNPPAGGAANPPAPGN